MTTTSLVHERAVGDTLSLFGVQLTRSGTPIDLTGRTITFKMYNQAGLLVASGAATSSSPTQGLVDYDFQAADVANAGTFYGFFEVSNGSEKDTYPTDGTGIQIVVFAEDADRSDATPEIDIIGAANSPARTRTVEGTVEERSMNELIKADQYAAAKAAAQQEAVPWGIRCARIRPPSTTDRKATPQSQNYPYPY